MLHTKRWMKLLHAAKRKSFFRRLIVTIVLITLLPNVAAAFFSYVHMKQNVEEETGNNKLQYLNQTINAFELILNRIQENSNLLVWNRAFRAFEHFPNGQYYENLHGALPKEDLTALYSYLNMSGIQARRLYGDEASRMLSEQADRSVSDLLAWIHHAVEKAFNQAKTAEETDTVVQQVQRYIIKNIDQDLSRDMIANHVFLNPDYLSRILKKETGYSVSDYVVNERMKLAKELLTETSIPVSTIAASVGHTNFSHFARIFKKHAGLGPTEYRNQYGKV